MKDYLNREQKNQLVTIMAVAQQIEGLRTLAGKTSKPLWEDWKDRDFLTKEEGKNIKMAHTYLLKFFEGVLARVNQEEKNIILKQLAKFDFRIVDDYTMQRIFRDMSNRMQNAIVPRKQFEDWCCEIMECNCRNCNKHWDECDLHKAFEENFIPESGFDLENCKYSYESIQETTAKLTPKELADKTTKDLAKRRAARAKKAESDVMYHLVETKQKSRRKKVAER